MALLHLRQHVEPLEHPVRLGNQRFADVKPRKMLALEQLDAVPALRNQRRHGRPGRPATDHDDVRICCSLEFPFRHTSTMKRDAFISNLGSAPASTTCTGTFSPMAVSSCCDTVSADEGWIGDGR